MVMNSFRFYVEDEDFTSYLQKLEALLNDTSNTENFLRDAGYELHDRYIRPLMPEWNPNLVYSPLEAKHQHFEHMKGFSSLALEYTGFTEQEHSKEGLRDIFWQFAINFDPFTHHLARDYAYFQETGIDSVVSPKQYVPTHQHFAEKGTQEYETEYHYKCMAYLEKLIRLERWERTNPAFSLYDYE